MQSSVINERASESVLARINTFKVTCVFLATNTLLSASVLKNTVEKSERILFCVILQQKSQSAIIIGDVPICPICPSSTCVPYGLVVRIRRSHRRGPGSIPGVGTTFFLCSISFLPKEFLKRKLNRGKKRFLPNFYF